MVDRQVQFLGSLGSAWFGFIIIDEMGEGNKRRSESELRFHNPNLERRSNHDIVCPLQPCAKVMYKMQTENRSNVFS